MVKNHMQTIGHRIVVLGVTGSGKSTLAKKLSEIYGYKYIELDNLFWKADWEMSSDDEFAGKVEQAVTDESWVVDGNYSRVGAPIIWSKADTLIWLDYPIRINYWRLWKRTWSRFLRRDTLWDAGNRENLWKHFCDQRLVVLVCLEIVSQKEGTI